MEETDNYCQTRSLGDAEQRFQKDRKVRSAIPCRFRDCARKVVENRVRTEVDGRLHHIRGMRLQPFIIKQPQKKVGIDCRLISFGPDGE